MLSADPSDVRAISDESSGRQPESVGGDGQLRTGGLGLVRVRPSLQVVGSVVECGGGLAKRCFQCATCSVVCDLSSRDNPFPRKEMLWVQWGLLDRLVGDPDIWLCHGCGDCSVRCPRGAKPSETLRAVRGLVVGELSFPRVVWRVVNDARCYPALLVLPGLLLGYAMWEAGTLAIHEGPVVWSKLLPHSVLFEGLFLYLVVWNFVVCVVGVVRHWREMRRLNPPSVGARLVPVWEAFGLVLVEFLFHGRFRRCGQNRGLRSGHMLVVFGFLAALIATAGGAVLDNVFGVVAPMPSPGAVAWAYGLGVAFKVSGVLGAVGIVGGGGLLLWRGVYRESEVGGSSVGDWVFLGVLFSTGLSGLLVYVSRLVGVGEVGYPLYFVHLVLALYLLGTFAYSKFAHVFYRTAAMTYAIHVGRLVLLQSASHVVGEPVVQQEPVVEEEHGVEEA